MAIKLQLKVGAEAAKVEAVEGFSKYAGETPPAGVYKAVVKQLQIKALTSDPTKQKVVAIIEWFAPKGTPEEKYNGYAVFDHLTLPESMEEEYADLKIGKINRLLDAISGDQKLRSAFWGGSTVLDDKGEKILRIGTKVAGGKDFKGFPVVVSAKNDTYTKKSKGENGEATKETIRTLRVNDIYPANHQMPSSAPVAAEDDVVLDEDVVDESIVDDSPEPEVPAEAGAEPEPEYVDPEGDEDGYVADDEPVEEAPVEVPDEAPAPESARQRRSAF